MVCKSRAMNLPRFIRQTQLCMVNYQWHYVPNSVFRHWNSAGYAQMHPHSCYLFLRHTLITFEWSKSWRYWPFLWLCSWCSVLLIHIAFGSSELHCKFSYTVGLLSYFWQLQILTIPQNNGLGAITLAYMTEKSYLVLYRDFNVSPSSSEIWTSRIWCDF